jgi:hypothetical protein
MPARWENEKRSAEAVHLLTARRGTPETRRVAATPAAVMIDRTATRAHGRRPLRRSAARRKAVPAAAASAPPLDPENTIPSPMTAGTGARRTKPAVERAARAPKSASGRLSAR